MGGTASTHLEGDGGCYSVKCRSAPLSVNDRAVLRVTKQARARPALAPCPAPSRAARADPGTRTLPPRRARAQELRVLSHVTLNALHDATQDADRDILLRLQWPDIAAVALAGRFLSVTEAPNHGAARPTARALHDAHMLALSGQGGLSRSCFAACRFCSSSGASLQAPGRRQRGGIGEFGACPQRVARHPAVPGGWSAAVISLVVVVAARHAPPQHVRRASPAAQ